jgi:hypothetical protein
MQEHRERTARSGLDPRRLDTRASVTPKRASCESMITLKKPQRCNLLVQQNGDEYVSLPDQNRAGCITGRTLTTRRIGIG